MDSKKGDKIWTLRMTDQTGKLFDKLDKPVQERIKKYFDSRVCTRSNPRSLGKQLTGNHNDKWSYRVGDYRILVQFKDDQMIILAIDVGHRKDVYVTFH
jgi:mRNA interferase RelE/StbE